MSIEQACMPVQSFDPSYDRIWNDRVLLELVARSDWSAVIDHCNEIGTNYFDYGRMWSLAMTAEFGPCGLHPSRTTNGRPDPAKCDDVPRVFEAMDDAVRAIRKTMGLKGDEE